MNLSGQAVSRLIKRFDIALDDLLIIHDDLDLPLGKIRIRPSGGSAGHKGVKSIITELGSQKFPRIRVGIGKPPIATSSIEITEADIVDYVLSDFTPEEKQIITQVIPRASEAILCLLTESLTAAMNNYN
jgi:PTH1 family peptidyl-tRNA hydrolase